MQLDADTGGAAVLAPEARHRLKCGERQLRKYVEAGVLPKPSQTAGGRNFWTELELQKAELRLKLKKEEVRARMAEGRKHTSSRAERGEVDETEHAGCLLWKEGGPRGAPRGARQGTLRAPLLKSQ